MRLPFYSKGRHCYSHVNVYNISMIDGYITTIEASKEYGLSDAHYRLLLERGTIKGVKAGLDWLISVESLEAYMNNRPKRGRKPGWSKKH